MALREQLLLVVGPKEERRIVSGVCGSASMIGAVLSWCCNSGTETSGDGERCGSTTSTSSTVPNQDDEEASPNPRRMLSTNNLLFIPSFNKHCSFLRTRRKRITIMRRQESSVVFLHVLVLSCLLFQRRSVVEALLLRSTGIQCRRQLPDIVVWEKSPSHAVLGRRHYGVRRSVALLASVARRDDNRYSFAETRQLDERLDKLERQAALTLEGFYESHLCSFSIKPGTAQRLSVTSTCFALRAILAGTGDTYESLIQLDDATTTTTTTTTLDPPKDATSSSSSSDRPIRLGPILHALLSSEWRDDDLFQVPLLLTTLLKVDSHRQVVLRSTMDERAASQVRKLVESVLSARPRRRLGLSGQRYSDYILYQCAQAYSALRQATDIPPPPLPSYSSSTTTSSLTGRDAWTDADASESTLESGIGSIPLRALPEGAASSLTLALSRCAEVSTSELYRQLALHTAGDQSDFDITRLAYSLLTYLISTASLTGTAGLELIPGQGPLPGSRIGPANTKLVRAALQVYFDEQQVGSGLWDKGQPIYKSFRKQGRNVGNAFVFSLDTVASMLEALPCEEFRPYLSHLERTLTWVEQHQTVEVIPDYCDPESGQCYGKPLRGWASPHLSPDTSPLAWSTAQVLTFVSRLRRRVRELMHRDVLQEFRGLSFSEEGVTDMSWDRLLDSDLGDGGAAGTASRTLKGVLEDRFIAPFQLSVESPSFGAAYSAVLFGPPGTAKTTICEALARKMGWDFLVVDTSVFLADGLGNVAARIRYVFERLQVLDRCVILFDEIEEFCLDRETPGIGMESRMLTTAMLTAINDLRRAKRSIFFLATNRLRAFDSAITRPGRFDLQLFVGTPNLQSRCILFQQQLSKISVESVVKEEAMKNYRSFLLSSWNETAMFMNYLEGVQFARACAAIVGNGKELTQETMATLLATQATVMTVRGSVRDEFIASMELSRL